MGDFNLMRSPENRNQPVGDVAEMWIFNDAISALGLIELPLHGRKYTWSNKQDPPMLERLDWFFTLSSWTTSYPESTAWALTMEVSDHVSCVIKINTDVPKSHIFRFANYWMDHADFMFVVEHGWNVPTRHIDMAKVITAKFKNLHRVLKAWQSKMSSLKQL